MSNEQHRREAGGRWDEGRRRKRQLARALRQASDVPLVVGLSDRDGGVRVIVGGREAAGAPARGGTDPLAGFRDLLAGATIDRMQPEGFGALTGGGDRPTPLTEGDAALVHRRRFVNAGCSVCRQLGGGAERLGPGSVCWTARERGARSDDGRPRFALVCGHVMLRGDERAGRDTPRNKLLHPSYDDGGEDEDVWGEAVAHTPVVYGRDGRNGGDLSVVELADRARPPIKSADYDPACVYRDVAVFEATADAGVDIPGRAWDLDAGRWTTWARAGLGAEWLESVATGVRVRTVLAAAGPPTRAGSLHLERDVRKDKVILRIRERLGRVAGTADPSRALLGQRVGKVGRTTGYTEGVVETIGADVLNFPYDGPARPAHFRRALVVKGDRQSFAECGDSGGPVFVRDGDTVRLLGYVFGVTTLADGVRRALVLPLRPALDALGYELFTG